MDSLQIWLHAVLFMIFVQVLRYGFFAVGAFFAVSRASEAWLAKHRIQAVPFQKNDLFRELKFSIFTTLIYGVVFGSWFNPIVLPHTRIYHSYSEYGKVWLMLSFPALVLLHDTYFYWMHRFLHLPKLFRLAHKTHHLSTNPSPLASMAFHPAEAFFEFIWIVPTIFIIPIHLKVLIGFSLFSLIYNVYGHLSVEIFPKSWMSNRVLKWLNSSTHHNAHHKYYLGNYGLYFLFWDRLFQTERKTSF